MSSLFGRAIAAVRLRLQELIQPPLVLQPVHGLAAHARARALESALAMASVPARGKRR